MLTRNRFIDFHSFLLIILLKYEAKDFENIIFSISYTKHPLSEIYWIWILRLSKTSLYSLYLWESFSEIGKTKTEHKK